MLHIDYLGGIVQLTYQGISELVIGNRNRKSCQGINTLDMKMDVKHNLFNWHKQHAYGSYNTMII